MLSRSFFAALLVFSTFSSVFSQIKNSPVDSLLSLIQKDKEDTNKVTHLDDLGLEYKNLGEYDAALYYNGIALQLSQKLNFQTGIANAYSSMGNSYDLKGDYSKALDYYFKALHIDEAQKSKSGMARRLGNIGLIYYSQSDYAKSLDYTFKALKIDTELHNKKGIARHLSNMGNIYYAREQYREALEYYFKALKMDEESGRKRGIQTNLGNIGVIYKEQGDYPLALEYFFKAMKIGEELNDKAAISTWQDNIGTLYILTKKYAEAEIYLQRSGALSDSIGDLYGIMGVYLHFSELYEKMGKPAKALEYYKQYTQLKDSIFNEEKGKDITRHEMNYEFDKKQAAAQAEQDKKDAVAAAEGRRKNMMIVFSAIGLLAVLVFAGFIFRSLRITRKQKNVIEEQKIIVELQKQAVEQQKYLVEEKQKEIIDSITYAKRLQEAILPPLDFVNQYFPDSFILYKPKDIVAGDFYWMEVVQGEAEHEVFVAAADCTGHGVPGALVSVVCSNALNRAVKEFGLHETGKILDKVTELVLETFEKSAKDVKDGMDISLLSLKFNTQSGKLINAQWSGAHNPLFYIKDEELIKIAANKQPIGKSDNRKPFTTHPLPLSDQRSPIVFYLFSDGYADQFGGPTGKKLMKKAFRELIRVNSNLDMADQKKNLDTTIEKWKGDREQVDDILIIGIRV